MDLIAYIDNEQLRIGKVHLCTCDKCKKRGCLELFIDGIDGSYVDCVKYNERFYDELIYFGKNLDDAIEEIQGYYTSKSNFKDVEIRFLTMVNDVLNKALCKESENGSNEHEK